MATLGAAKEGCFLYDICWVKIVSEFRFQAIFQTNNKLRTDLFEVLAFFYAVRVHDETSRIRSKPLGSTKKKNMEGSDWQSNLNRRFSLFTANVFALTYATEEI